MSCRELDHPEVAHRPTVHASAESALTPIKQKLTRSQLTKATQLFDVAAGELA